MLILVIYPDIFFASLIFCCVLFVWVLWGAVLVVTKLLHYVKGVDSSGLHLHQQGPRSWSSSPGQFLLYLFVTLMTLKIIVPRNPFS